MKEYLRMICLIASENLSRISSQCKFSTCSHTSEKGCAVCNAVENGKIPKSRHDSYVQMYNDVKDIKEWEIKR